MLKYLSIDGGILANKTIPPVAKIIISYVSNLNKGDKYFYGTRSYMAETLGIRFDFLDKTLDKMLDLGVLQVTTQGIGLGHPLYFIAEANWKL